MAEAFKIEVDDRAVVRALNELLRRGEDLSPAMASIAAELLSLTELAFQEEGPGWPPLAPATILRRTQRGHWPGKMLQVSGALAASIQVDSGKDYAEIGSAKEYAAIHQFGGTAGRGHRTTIPPRPYLPITGASGELTPQATESILEILNRYLGGSWEDHQVIRGDSPRPH
ncbi:MAG: phage virion morphogenesis protein [Pseudomonadota bacterium]